MNSQSRVQSFVESVTQTFISYVIAVIIGQFVYGYYQVPIDLVLNMKITAVFTVASILRGYIIRRWFNHMASPKTMPSPVPRVPLKPEELTEDQIATGIRDITELLIKNYQRFFTQRITIVQCPVKFPGWGYIAGSSVGWQINDKLSICEGDSDLGFTEICIVLENKAAMLIERRYESGPDRCVTQLQVVTPELEGRLIFRGSKFETLEEFRALPEPVQRVMIDVIAALLDRKKQFQLDDPTDAILRYQS